MNGSSFRKDFRLYFYCKPLFLKRGIRRLLITGTVYLHVSYYSNSQKPSTENPFEDDVLTPLHFSPFRIWAQKLRRAYLIVVVMLCIVLVMVYCTLAFILIYSVRGIGIVLVNACNNVYIYVCIYMDVLFMSF